MKLHLQISRKRKKKKKKRKEENTDKESYWLFILQVIVPSFVYDIPDISLVDLQIYKRETIYVFHMTETFRIITKKLSCSL